MEVKIDKEIRNYIESIFFELSLRQFVFSLCACVVAVFLFKPYLGIETLSWVCILAASPFAAFCFFKYNGMVAEKAIYAWYKSTFLISKS